MSRFYLLLEYVEQTNTHPQLQVLHAGVDVRVHVAGVLDVVAAERRAYSQLFVRHRVQRHVDVVRLVDANDLRRNRQILTGTRKLHSANMTRTPDGGNPKRDNIKMSHGALLAL